MSEISNKRKLAEAVNLLTKSATPQRLKDVFDALAQVSSDLTAADCKIILQFGDEPALTVAEGKKP